MRRQLDMQIPTESILGCSITKLRPQQCVEVIRDWLDSNAKSKTFICANPHSLVESQKDKTFGQAIYDAHLVTPDGVGIIIASKLLGGTIRKRVTGSDIFWGLSDVLNKARGRSYFFLGSTEETLDAIKEKMIIEYPNIVFAGSYSPPFKPDFSVEDNRKMVEAVNAARPDVLWVGMTAPKQEKWIHQHRDQLKVKFIGAIGAVFDFYIGRVKRSHPFFQKIGLEWLPRLLQEPRRLWRRNFISNPKFIMMVLAQRLKNKQKS